MVDYWAHAYADDPERKRTELVETEGFDAEIASMNAEMEAPDLPAPVSVADAAAWETVESETFGDGNRP